jgi:hypothetical protein
VATLGSEALEFERPAPVTLALTDPIVAVGTPPAVTKLCAFLASAAKPTEAGFARKTAYTFFRNVSPMIHAGELPTEEYAKIEPRHSLFESSVSLKSFDEMGQVWPPKEKATLTVVEQAVKVILSAPENQFGPGGGGRNDVR